MRRNTYLEGDEDLLGPARRQALLDGMSPAAPDASVPEPPPWTPPEPPPEPPAWAPPLAGGRPPRENDDLWRPPGAPMPPIRLTPDATDASMESPPATAVPRPPGAPMPPIRRPPPAPLAPPPVADIQPSTPDLRYDPGRVYTTMPGWDTGKLNTLTKQTAKYDFARAVQTLGGSAASYRGNLDKIAQFLKTRGYPTARAMGDDKIDFGDGAGPIDVITSGGSWWWSGDAGPAAGVVDGGGSETGAGPTPGASAALGGPMMAGSRQPFNIDPVAGLDLQQILAGLQGLIGSSPPGLSDAPQSGLAGVDPREMLTGLQGVMRAPLPEAPPSYVTPDMDPRQILMELQALIQGRPSPSGRGALLGQLKG